MTDLMEWTDGRDPLSLLEALDFGVGMRKKKAKTMPTPYSKLNSDKKAEALDLFHAIAKKGFREQFSKLANDYGVPLADKAKEGRSAMHLIAENGHVQLMKDLLKKHLPQLDDVLQDGVSFREQLQRAEQYRSEATLTLGKYVKNKSKRGWKPLHFAVKACTSLQAGERGVEMVALLLLVQGDSSMLATQRRVRAKKSGEETTRSKSGGESPVHIAAKYGAIRALELIWEWCDVFRREGENNEKFAPFTEPDEKGWTPFHHAVATNRSEVVEWLLDRERRDLTRLNIDAPSEKGYTALMTAAEYSHNEMCKLLMGNKAKVDCAAADGLTALHLAAMHDNKELVELLLQHEASCKAQDEHGNTPLHIAHKKYCLEAAPALSDRDKTVLKVPNKEGHTPENIPPEDKECSLPHIFLVGCDQEADLLEEVILCGPNQLPNVMKEVVKFREHSDNLSASDRRALKQASVASEEALAVLFAEIPSGSISDKKKVLQCLCLLLRAYGLIVKMSTGRDEASHQHRGGGPQYLVPCLLGEMTTIPKPPRKCFSFVADFLGYLPQEVFMRFVCLAALKAKCSILNQDAIDEYHLKQDYCNVEGLARAGDAWYISCDATNHKMVFEVSLPHVYKGEMMEYVCFASKLLDQLCKDLKLNGLLYRVGKEFLCEGCGAEKLIKLHEKGRTLKDDEIKCSCEMPINTNDLLKQTVTGSRRLREKPTEKELRMHICSSAAILKWKKVCTLMGIQNQKVQCALSSNNNDNSDAFFECLMFWLEGNADESITWTMLLEALEHAELKELAKDLKSKLLEGSL